MLDGTRRGREGARESQGPIFVSGEEDNKSRGFFAKQRFFCSSFLASIQIQGKNHSWARQGRYCKVKPNGDRVTALSFWYQSGGLKYLIVWLHVKYDTPTTTNCSVPRSDSLGFAIRKVVTRGSGKTEVTRVDKRKQLRIRV